VNRDVSFRAVRTVDRLDELWHQQFTGKHRLSATTQLVQTEKL
jgi:hypothetical protein